MPIRKKQEKKIVMRKNVKSHIPQYRMLRAEADDVRNLLRCHSEPDVRLYNHVLQSNIRQHHRHAAGSPIPWTTIQRYLPGAIAHRLSSFIEIGGYWPGHCREYRVKDEYLIAYSEIGGLMSAEEYLAEPHVCFDTGRLMNSPPLSKLTYPSRMPLPEGTRAAIKVLDRNKCLANLPAVEMHEQQRRAEYQEVSQHHDKANAEYKRARGRFINDSSCRAMFLDYKPTRYSGDIWSYKPAWRATSTGRLHVVGGCMQSASGEMKRRAYSGIEGLKNYDIKSSQIFITITLLEQAGLDASWLIEYVETPNYKEVYGNRVNIPGNLFKRIVIAMCMGAQLPESIEQARYAEFSILDYLAEVAHDKHHLSELLKGLREVVEPLVRALKQWHAYLLDKYIPKHRRGAYLPNAAGFYLNLTELRLTLDKGSDVPKVAAHLLQGLEAACIQEMIGRSAEANFTPISCEHDGFIVSSGEPDLTLWDEITCRHGLTGMQLVYKAL